MPEPANKVGLSTLLSHFEDGLGRGGDPDASAQVAAVRMRYSQGELGYTSALHELQGVVGRGALLEAARELNTGSTSRGDQADAPPSANPPPKVEPTAEALEVLSEPATSDGRRDSGGSASDAPMGRSTVHPTGTFVEPGSLHGAAPWQGTFAFQQPGPPGNKEGKQSMAILPPDAQFEPHSPEGDVEPPLGATSPTKGNPVLRIDVNLEPAADAPNRKKRGREPVAAPFMPNGSLVLERPKRQVKSNTRFDPDMAATRPQLGARAATSSPAPRSPSSSLGDRRTPPPPSPRMAAAAAMMMSSSWDAVSRQRSNCDSPVRMSPRLAARVGQAVPACDALLMLGAVASGTSMPHASGVGIGPWGGAGQSMMSPPEPRTPLSPRGNSRQQQTYPSAAHYSGAGSSDPPAICLAASMAANSSPSARRVGNRSGASPSDGGSASEPKRKPPSTGGKRGRVVHSAAFKLRLVREALLRPPENRIKPTCRRYPSVEPCQLRKWINGRANLEKQAREAREKNDYVDEDE